MTYQSKIYLNAESNPTVKYSDSTKKNIAVCFSGGGSRALTCAWGQMLGLSTNKIFNNARYISSVSGGTWATAIYSFLPATITDEQLLGTYYKPENLSLKEGNNLLNVNHLKDKSLGKAPEGMKLDTLILKAGVFLSTHKPEQHQWLWAYLVGELILEPFGLRSEGSTKWTSKKYFSLSKEHLTSLKVDSQKTDSAKIDTPNPDDFYFVRDKRPFHIMNNNIMIKLGKSEGLKSNIILLPNQVTPVAGGVKGESPDGSINGGGVVESYSVSSTLKQPSAISNPVKVEINQPYSLIDIVSTSSAFFAETIARYVKSKLEDDKTKQAFIEQIKQQLRPKHKGHFFKKTKGYFSGGLKNIISFIKKYLEKKLLIKAGKFGSIVPIYNYWPLTTDSKNKAMQFTDGGSLDNTGIIGMLAQTELGEGKNDAIKLVVFDNTERPLQKEGAVIIAADQMAALFGIEFNNKSKIKFKPFTENQKKYQTDEFSANSLITVFDNTISKNSTKTPFNELVEGVYAASCAANSTTSIDDSKICSDPAFYQMKLTTVQNDLTGISAGREVEILYIQNTKILNWQNKIGDTKLKNEIIKGQKEAGNKLDPNRAFDNFPYYNTEFKIGLTAKESNMLSQMWAWALADEKSPLSKKIKTFMQ
ncbi:MAG: hypothetical protein HRU38_13210 [Saccharospirillaceae bacterium]|nr:hypothetical protein [Pseudomonadales bacterium]NRB79603.1 hypothetical protein [Saccharospirillaceae bacterium]